MATIYIDATRFSAVVVCTCGWRGITGNLVTAWGAGAAHLRICHQDLPSARRALQAARDARYRRQAKTSGQQRDSAGNGPSPRVDRTTRPPRRPDTATTETEATRPAQDSLGSVRGSADLLDRSNMRETSAPSIN